MKSSIKKVMIVLVVLAAVVDWPVETQGINVKPLAKPLAKLSGPLLRSCAKSTMKAERVVNVTTLTTKKTINKAAEGVAHNPRTGEVLIRSVKATQSNAQSNAQTTSKPRLVNCPKCCGRGSVRGTDGYVYSCSLCRGKGKILKKNGVILARTIGE